MASRPTTIPQLDTSKTNRVAPVAGKIASGYVLNDLFPSSNANYLHGWAGDWLEWLQERSEDGTTPGTDLTLRGLDALTATGDGGVLTLIGGDGGGTSGDGGDILLLPGGVTSGVQGRVGVSQSAFSPLALMHIRNGASGVGATPSNTLLALENNGQAFISLLTPNGTARGIFFSEASDNDAGGIVYDAAVADGLEFRTNGNTTRVTIDASGNTRLGGVGTTDTLLHLYGAAPDITFEDTVGDKYLMGNSDGSFRIYNVTDSRFGMYIDGNGLVGVGNFSSPAGTLHVFTADAGVITPNVGADDLVIENSTYVGMTFMAPATSGGSTIAFAYPGSDLAGQRHTIE
jgi:hypothetical protein